MPSMSVPASDSGASGVVCGSEGVSSLVVYETAIELGKLCRNALDLRFLEVGACPGIPGIFWIEVGAMDALEAEL